MTLLLSTIPGFADQKDSSLNAEKASLGVALNRVSQNAAMGMVRFEPFYGLYKDGDTVDLPVSPIDGYQYQRNELTYVWCVQRTVDLDTAWITGPGSLWWGSWLVNQSTGKVSCAEFYRNSHSSLDGNSALTHDGVLGVFVIAQRQKTHLIIAQPHPYSYDFPDSFLDSDSPQTDALMHHLNNGAKKSVVNTECIYMGEFYNGQTVPKPVSPADGYRYEYDGEVAFMTSWRWTTLGNSANVQLPDNSNRQLQDIKVSVAPTTGVVSTNVYYKDDSDTGINTTTHGRVAVFAFCSRNRMERNGRFNYDAAVPPGQWTFDSKSFDDSPASSSAQASDYSYVLGPDGAEPALQIDTAPAIGVENSPGVYQTVSHKVRDGDTYRLVGWIKKVSGTGRGVVDLLIRQHDGTLSSLIEIEGATTPSGWQRFEATGSTAGAIERAELHVWNFGSSDNVNQFANVQVYRTNAGGSSADAENDFAEIELDVFMPGETLRASTMRQLTQNVDEALVSPEVFGPVAYDHGDTVPLPVSTQDDYTYSRDELFYMWNWKYTGPPTGDDDIRIVAAFGRVDDAGLVHASIWRFERGQHAVETHDGTLSVIVIAQRAAQHSALFVDTTTGAPQSDPANEGVNDPQTQVNGV